MGASKDAMDEEGNAAADLGLVARIRESFDSLTATEREAAQFILGHLTDVLVCNSVELSQLSGISQPTLSRLYRKLGYANAGEFRRDVRRVHRPGSPELSRHTQCDDLVADHLRRDEESLKRTFEGIDRGATVIRMPSHGHGPACGGGRVPQQLSRGAAHARTADAATRKR